MRTILLFLLLSLPVLVFLAWRYLGNRATLRRRRLLGTAIRSEWIGILESNVRLYRKLPPDLRQKLHGCINLFLDEKQFVGCEGLEITDEIRITVAGNACLLVLNDRKLSGNQDLFPEFTTILIYPGSYVAREINYDGLIEHHGEETRAGEAWHGGPMVLSWTDVLRGSRIDNDGFNVVLHEFAHKLDEENSRVDGLPVLADSPAYADWARVLSEEYRNLKERVEHGKHGVLDGYGATSPPEFFAVATEAFFEKPQLMKHHLPDLYRQLERLYGLSPDSWNH